MPKSTTFTESEKAQIRGHTERETAALQHECNYQRAACLVREAMEGRTVALRKRADRTFRDFMAGLSEDQRDRIHSDASASGSEILHVSIMRFLAGDARPVERAREALCRANAEAKRATAKAARSARGTNSLAQAPTAEKPAGRRKKGRSGTGAQFPKPRFSDEEQIAKGWRDEGWVEAVRVISRPMAGKPGGVSVRVHWPGRARKCTWHIGWDAAALNWFKHRDLPLLAKHDPELLAALTRWAESRWGALA